ncbi:hypothetical protein SPONL_1665 [uncultured Candidatus Thioglobus sp.]|nr:hypothetical protein SPONL_1665 [uncultured Candidatus Thioglobus sp.]
MPAKAKVFVFGSRLNDDARGGDVDLIVETIEAIDWKNEVKIKRDLEQKLHLPFDILFVNKTDELTTFQQLAFCDAVELDMETNTTNLQKQQLADLLIAIERCVYFLNETAKKIDFPLTAEILNINAKDVEFYANLSTINERFAKLQDVFAQAMRHGSILLGKSDEIFLKVLVFYEKVGVIQSTELWHTYRTRRNQVAHDYGIDYKKTAGHFNELKELIVPITEDANNFLKFCKTELKL